MSRIFRMLPLALFILTNFYIASAMSTERETVSKDKAADPNYTNKVAPSDSYTMFKHLMEVKEDIAGEKVEQEPKVVKTVKQALQSLLEAALKGFVDGFLPHVDRQRREATDDRRSYLDIAIGAIGALLGRQECSEIIACRWRQLFNTLKIV